MWHLYEGDPLERLTIDAAALEVERHLLGGAGQDSRPVHVVSAGVWQAARTTGAYTLVGCSVAPGFDFADFQMLRDLPEESSRVKPHLGDALEMFR